MSVRQVRQLRALVLLDLLVDGLAARAGDLDRLVDAGQLVVLAVDLHLQAGLRDEVFQREVGQVGVEVDRAGALAA